MGSAERIQQSDYRSRSTHSERYKHRSQSGQPAAGSIIEPKLSPDAKHEMVSSSPGMFSSTVGIMLALFIFSAAFGLIYLAGCSRVTVETFRTKQLKDTLNRTRERNHILQQQTVIAELESSVVKSAVKQGMIPLDEQAVVFAGEDRRQNSQVIASSSIR